jgi:uncharacterized repeat protein (TIGR04052 family)
MTRRAVASTVAALALVTACGAPADVELRFEGLVGDEPARCGATYAGIGTSGSTLTLLDFRLFVHDVRLVTADGREVPVELTQDDFQHDDVALLDFEDGTNGCDAGTPAQRLVVRGTVSDGGPFRGVRFRFGVPADLNHGDASTAPAPLNTTSMFWSWNGGYKFLRADVRLKEGAPRNFHLGSTGCQGGDAVTSCSHPNRPEISLDSFDPSSGKVIVDYAALVADADLSKDGGGAPGCMSGVDDPECAAIFPRLGLSLSTGAPEGNQSAFRVE